MGVTIHYRGRIDDIERIESLEDCVIDLVLALGGQVQIWRSADNQNPERIVRGLLIELDPGQETLSLLFSPEGFLLPLTEIEAAEQYALSEAPWCFIKTQFGSVEGHAAIVELLSELKTRFLSELEVSDESEYWTHRDPQRLAEAMRRNGAIIKAVAEGLREYPLSSEASEDVDIIATRIQRIAERVHRSFQQSNNTTNSNDYEEFGAEWPKIEAHHDQLYSDGVAQTLRLQRSLETRLQAGETIEDALEAAFEEFAAQRNASEPDSDLDSLESGWIIEESQDDFVSDESWKGDFSCDEEVGSAGEIQSNERNPLLERATQLYLSISTLEDKNSDVGFTSLLSSAGQVCGGLAQALSLTPSYEKDDERGHATVQLKRALRGAAFLRAAVLNRPASEVSSHFLKEIASLQGEILDLLRDVRCR